MLKMLYKICFWGVSSGSYLVVSKIGVLLQIGAREVHAAFAQKSKPLIQELELGWRVPCILDILLDLLLRENICLRRPSSHSSSVCQVK